MIKIRKKEIVLWFLLTLHIIGSIYYYQIMPEEMAIHWSQGRPDNWASKKWVMTLPLIASLSIYLVITFFSKLLIKIFFVEIDKYRLYVFGIKLVVIVFILANHLDIIINNLGYEFSYIRTILFSFSPIILAILYISAVWTKERLKEIQRLKTLSYYAKEFFILFGISLLGILCILPYISNFQRQIFLKINIPLVLILFFQFIQSAFIFGPITWFGIKLSKKVNLGALLLESIIRGETWNNIRKRFYNILKTSILIGVITSMVIIFFDSIFNKLLPSTLNDSVNVNPAIWQRFLASFYGAINEEIFSRLFLMSLILWILMKIRKRAEIISIEIWIAIIISSIMFGIGHLPLASNLISITLPIVLRILILNGIGGIVFGYLYWKKGLEAAMIAHFSADIILHVVFPLFLRST